MGSISVVVRGSWGCGFCCGWLGFLLFLWLLLLRLVGLGGFVLFVFCRGCFGGLRFGSRRCLLCLGGFRFPFLVLGSLVSRWCLFCRLGCMCVGFFVF